MSPRWAVQPVRRLWFAPLAACALLGLGAEPTQAGCAAHHRPAAPSRAVDAHLLALIVAGTDDAPDSAPRRPCSGPSCSGKPAPPTEAPQVVRLVVLDGSLSRVESTPPLDPARPFHRRPGPAHNAPTLDEPERPPRS